MQTSCFSIDDPIPMEVFESPEELRDLEELQFSKQVISDIASRRKRHENKLVWPSLENYIEYIATERRLLALVGCRDRLLEKKKMMEGRLIKKINRLYKDARCKLGDDYQLLMDYFQFLKEVKAKIRAKEIIELLMEQHPEKEEVFLAAITWYIQTHNPTSIIHQTIDTALIHHPSSKDIFVEAFTFELKTLDVYFQSHGQSSDEIVEKIKSYTDLFFTNVAKDIDQYFDVLDKFDGFQHISPAKDYFQQKIMEVCKEEAAFWENLVKRQGSCKASTAEQRMSRCIASYEEGLNVVPQDKKSDLWRLYLKFLLDACTWVADEEDSMRADVKFVSEKFEQAHRDRYLAEDLYFFWLELDKRIRCAGILQEVNGSKSERVNMVNFEIFEKGLQMYPQSIKLWKAYLSATINHDKTSTDITKIFERAIAALPQNTAQLWLMFLSNCEQIEEGEYIEAAYSKALKDPQVALAVARKYLSWMYLIHGIERCRSVYDSFVEEKLPCKEIHKAMLKFEFLEFNGSFVRWEQVYKNSLEQFPHDVDMWMDYMQFHLKYKRSSQETVSALYTRALGSLPDSSQLLLRQRMAAEEVSF